MKEITKKRIGNALFLIIVALILFTPLGFHVKVFTSKLMSYTPFATPSELESGEQLRLKSYDWSLVDTKGKAFNLEQGKGKVVFINFWATWCPPCVAEMPDLQKLYDAYGDKITFLFVASDEVDRVNEFLDRKGYTFPVQFSRNKAPEGLESPTIPTTYLLDRSGKIVMKETMVADWNDAEFTALLDRLLQE